MRNMQKTHRANSVQHINNLRQSISTLQQMIRDLEAQIAHYKAAEDEVAELDRRGSSRLAYDRQQNEEEIHALNQTIEGLRVQLDLETMKYERMLRDRNASVKNLADAEKGARRQVDELAARDATITTRWTRSPPIPTRNQRRSRTSAVTPARNPPRSMTYAINGRDCETGWTSRQHSTRRLWKRETLNWPTCESYSTPAPWRQR